MNDAATVKERVKEAVSRSGVLRLARVLGPARVAVLRYHSVQDEPARFEHSIGAAIIHERGCFARQMELVARRYDAVSLDDVLLFLRGEKRLPRRPVAVTFDDGYRDNREIAAPVMDALGIPATFYVTASAIAAERLPWFCRLRHAFGTTRASRFPLPGDDRAFDFGTQQGRRAGFLAASAACASRSGAAQAAMIESIEVALGVEPLAPGRLMMDWDDVRALRKGGHIVGSHTATHPNMARIPEAEAERELRESRCVLEGRLGEPVLHFSYPNPILQPHWTPATSGLAARAGYRTAVTSESGTVRRGSDPYSLRRLSVPNGVEALAWALDCAFLGRAV